jgi:Cysteine rich repeat.
MRILAIAGVVGLGLCASASAQTAAEREACEADYQKFCSSVVPGGGRIVECLSKHLDELSPACKKVVAEHAR